LHGGNEEYSKNIKVKAVQAQLEYERRVKTLGSRFAVLDCSSVIVAVTFKCELHVKHHCIYLSNYPTWCTKFV